MTVEKLDKMFKNSEFNDAISARKVNHDGSTMLRVKFIHIKPYHNKVEKLKNEYRQDTGNAIIQPDMDMTYYEGNLKKDPVIFYKCE